EKTFSAIPATESTRYALGVESAGPRLRVGSLVLRFPGRGGHSDSSRPVAGLEILHPFELGPARALWPAGGSDPTRRARGAGASRHDGPSHPVSCRAPGTGRTICRCELWRADRRSACGHKSNLRALRFDPDPGGRRAHTAPGLAPVALSRPSFHTQLRRYWIGRAHPGGPYWHAACF